MSFVRRFLSVIFAALFAGVAILLSAPNAYAFLGIGDSSDVLLAQLLANSVQQLARLSDSVSTLQKSYDQARKITGYAQDGYALAASFHHFSLERFGKRLQSDLEFKF